jgi:hypothetical protein
MVSEVTTISFSTDAASTKSINNIPK